MIPIVCVFYYSQPVRKYFLTPKRTLTENAGHDEW
jgi:hypothetical protein